MQVLDRLYRPISNAHQQHSSLIPIPTRVYRRETYHQEFLRPKKRVDRPIALRSAATIMQVSGIGSQRREDTK
jgi:hypothetical protein